MSLTSSSYTLTSLNDAPSYQLQLSMSSSDTGILTLSFYKNGVLFTGSVYVFATSWNGSSWAPSGASGTMTGGSRVYSYTSVKAFDVHIYSDSTKAELLTTSFISFGETGIAGPVGTPGYLGLMVRGTTLSLKGFASNGELEAAEGYIYIEEQRMSVPQYSLTLTGSGQGYILFDPSSSTPVRYTIMTPTANGIVFKEYNSPHVPVSSPYIIGQFYKEGISISSAKIIPAQTITDFNTSNFMEILKKVNTVDYTIDTWANALGINTVFERIAVLHAFINNLTVNRVKSPNYAEDANGIPADGYLLDSVTKMMKAVNAVFYNLRVHGGTFEGALIHDSFKTVEKKNGAPIQIPAKTRWNTDVLYSTLSSQDYHKPENIFTNANPDDFRSVLYCAKVDNYSRSISSGVEYTFLSYTSLLTGSVRYSNDIITLSRKGWGNAVLIRIYVNNALIQQYINASAGADLIWSYTFPVTSGDVVDLRFETDYNVTLESYYGRFAMAVPYMLTAKYSLINNAYYRLLAVYKKGTYYSTSLSFSSPVSFNSSSNIDFVGIDSLLSQLSSYPDNALTNITGSFYVNGNIQTATSYYKTSSSLSIVFSNAPPLEMYVDTAEGASFGYYNISGSFTILAEVDSVKSKSLIPFIDASSNTTEEGTDLGSAAFRIRNITMAGDIYGGGNIGGFNNITGNKVYGAVFN